MKETIGNVLLNLDYYDGEDAYSDGSIEDRLLEIVKTTPKEDYQKVILTEKSWPIFYHLSPERENILDWYEWKDDASVFEVGAGCGAISGVLCRNAKRVVANDLSKRRSTMPTKIRMRPTWRLWLEILMLLQKKWKNALIT